MKLPIAGALLILLLPVVLYAQAYTEKGPYGRLQKQIELHQGTPKVWPYLNKYLQTAKREGNKTEIVAAYKEMLHECEEGQRLAYADSMVTAAKDSKVNDLIGASYLTKGILHYQRNEHQLALDNYINANKYVVNTDDLYLKHKVKYSIAQIKFYLGYYQEAISLFRDCTEYFKAEDHLPYLKSLHGLTVSYLLTDDLSLASQTNKLALNESARLGIKDMLPYIESSSGILHYKQGDHQKAINSLRYALPLIKKDRDYQNEAIAHFFLGKAYWDSTQQEKAVMSFKAVDDIFMRKNYLRPDLRQSYEYLIKYFHHAESRDEELKYVNQLLRADSLLGKEFRYLVKKIHKEYDTAELLAEKEKIQAELERSRYSGILFKGTIAFLVATVAYLIYRQKKLRKLHRVHFQELINKEQPVTAEEQPKPQKVSNINPMIADQILEKINDFERKKSYLKKDLNATRLAEQFNTNYKYLCEVIKVHRHKGFTNYLNDLRIDYIVERLKTEPVLRRYTNSTLAAEAGFKTTQHFTTAFKKRTKISPGYFVKEYDKLEEEATS
ncbi:helix-turn-helix domain-containing protein [Flavobacterium sp.]|uniref:helix-turn-helix domain-containing protein n=1 Tax=Flavobacterium sp. TaxID=239 RepID=UPI0040334E13